MMDDSTAKGLHRDFMISLSIVLIVLVLILYLVLFKRRNKNCPPGPRGWPILGNLPSLSLHSEKEMYEWNKTYGPVCKLKMASLDFVVLGSVEAVEEAFVKKSESFSDRMQNTIPGLSGDKGLIFINYSARLKEQRRFGLVTLKEFGMGRKSIEPSILEKCSELCDNIEIASDEGTSISINFMIYETISSIISHLVFNKNLAAESVEFRNFLHILVKGAKGSALSGITVFYPLLKKIPPFSWGQQGSKMRERNTLRLIQEQIDDHKRTRDPKNPRDFIDCFLNRMDSGKNDSQGFDEEQLSCFVRDLFLAGSETTATTICWTILFLSKTPEIQNKLYDEISDVLGEARQPTTALADNMPYTKAVIQETLRMRPIAPIGIPHRASRDDTIMGYRIPKGTLVVSNIYRIQNDENIWKNPERFDPSRHIDSNGKFAKSPNMLPFSIGARQCLGLQLANMELFLFIASLFQRYSFTLADEYKDIDMRGKNIFVLKPYPFEIIATKR